MIDQRIHHVCVLLLLRCLLRLLCYCVLLHQFDETRPPPLWRSHLVLLWLLTRVRGSIKNLLFAGPVDYRVS